MKKTIIIIMSGFIVATYAISLYAMEKNPLSALLSQQPESMKNYGTLTGSTLDGIHEQQIRLADDEQNESALSQFSKRIEIGSKCGAGLCASMVLVEAGVGACSGYGISFACLPTVLITTAVSSCGVCLCTSCFCSDKSPCDICSCLR